MRETTLTITSRTGFSIEIEADWAEIPWAAAATARVLRDQPDPYTEEPAPLVGAPPPWEDDVEVPAHA